MALLRNRIDVDVMIYPSKRERMKGINKLNFYVPKSSIVNAGDVVEVYRTETTNLCLTISSVDNRREGRMSGKDYVETTCEL